MRWGFGSGSATTAVFCINASGAESSLETTAGVVFYLGVRDIAGRLVRGWVDGEKNARLQIDGG